MIYCEAVVAVTQSAVCHLAVLRQRDPLARNEHQHRNEGAEHKAIQEPLRQLSNHRATFVKTGMDGYYTRVLDRWR